MKNIDYPFTVRRLKAEEGGGYLIEFLDLPGCLADGETIAETIKHGAEAVECWKQAAIAAGRDIPVPGASEKATGKWLQRAPKWLHSRLVTKCKEEGVSLNTLVISLLAADVGYKKT